VTIRFKPKEHGMQKIGILLIVILLMFGCGGGMTGTYSDEHGIVTYEFQSNGKVLVTSLGGTVELGYEKDGDRIRVKTAEGGPAQVLTLTENGDLDMGLAVLKRRN